MKTYDLVRVGQDIGMFISSENSEYIEDAIIWLTFVEHGEEVCLMSRHGLTLVPIGNIRDHLVTLEEKLNEQYV